jgi:hypothetical protein
MSYEDLMTELSAVPGVDEDIKVPTGRKLSRGEAESLMARMPRLRKQAYLRNSLQSTLMLDDLFTSIDGVGPCLALMPGMVCDLSRLPAKNLLNSNALKWCFDTGKVELVGRASFVASFKKVQEEASAASRSELQIYGGQSSRTNPHEEGEGAAMSLANGADITDSGSDLMPIETSGRDMDMPPPPVWEDSPYMQQIVSNMPVAREPAVAMPRRVR